jgi:perosamine synthetase
LTASRSATSASDEKRFASYCGRSHGIAVSNGSAALEAAVAALKFQPGDEVVIVPSFTIISCVTPIVRMGAVPIVVDCDPLTWNMDPNQVEACITARTKAIMAVHIYGLPVEMDRILDIASRHGLRIIVSK